MTDLDDIKASLTEIKTTLRTLTDGQWDVTQRVVELERARPMTASRTDMATGDMNLAGAMQANKSDTDAKIAAMGRALADASESRGSVTHLLIGVLGVMVVVAVKLPADNFVPAIVTIAGIATGAWAHFRARTQRETKLNGSIPPPKGP